MVMTERGDDNQPLPELGEGGLGHDQRLRDDIPRPSSNSGGGAKGCNDRGAAAPIRETMAVDARRSGRLVGSPPRHWQRTLATRHVNPGFDTPNK